MAQSTDEDIKKLLDNLQSDLKNISLETKRRHPNVKESAEETIVKIRNASSNATPLTYLSNQVLYPLVQGCETKDNKVVNLSLQVIQRLITAQVLDAKGAKYVVETMWMLMESGIEEVRLLQTLTLLSTTNTVLQGEAMARCLVICFRLAFSKDQIVSTTAGATVRHLVSAVFDRAMAVQDSDTRSRENLTANTLVKPAASPSGKGGASELPGLVADAYLLFQDLIQLVNADQPIWLQGIVEMTRTFGLELSEGVLHNYSPVFYKYIPFRVLLKEKVCSLVIKLFSPNIKYRGGGSGGGGGGQQAAAFDKPYYHISLRLLRVVSVLVEKYYRLLVTECEIFLSLIVKFLDPDKPGWQRALALELIHRMVVQPRLLREFCRWYDCRDHATNIFQDMVNSLGAYVQNVFICTPQTEQVQPQPSGTNVGTPSMLAGLPVGPGISVQPGFYYRSVYKPLVISWLGGTAKCTYLDMTDRQEPPPLQDGYGVSLAFSCLLDIIRSIGLIVDNDQTDVDQNDDLVPVSVIGGDEPVDLAKVRCQLLESSWCGLLCSLALLLDASTEDSTAENILKSMQLFASLAARLGLSKQRDSFITAVCKASLPPHYTLSVLKATPSTQLVTGASHLANTGEGGEAHGAVDGDYRHQVVAVGTPLPTASLPPAAQQGPVMLTAKNLQCMRAILSVAHCHGDLLGAAWHIVLTTLQHLVWILGLKPTAGQGGHLKAVKSSSETNAVITTAVMADLPVLAKMLSNLFESSCNLSEDSLNHLIDALIVISGESLQLAYNNREPSLFAVAKLLETGDVNLMRIQAIWVKITCHLLDVSSHPHAKMREWGGDALCNLMQAALKYQHKPPLHHNPKLQTLLLGPLVELSAIPQPDIRSRQLECVMTILHSSAEALTQGWPLVLSVIGALRPQHSEALVRTGFQALQLVLTDFLPLTPHTSLPLCVDTAAKFGSQTQDLNISLTAVGLLWNLSDYFYQNQNTLRNAIIAEPKILPDLPGYKEMCTFDKLWMCLFSRLGDLCLDSRPATRKSAGQTLFSTIAAHGSLLQTQTWQAVLWQVLFPLLDKVSLESGLASTEKHSDNLLIHHTRNTEKKQWAETQVLTISGVARVFVTKRKLLAALGDFPKAWRLLLEHIEKLSLSTTGEVSLAALKSFHEMVVTGDDTDVDSTKWNAAWKSWISIGKKSSVISIEELKSSTDPILPSQAFVTALAHIFPLLFTHIKNEFSTDDLDALSAVIVSLVHVPVITDSELGYILAGSDDSLLPLHLSIIKCITAVESHSLSAKQILLPGVFRLYEKLSNLVHSLPQGSELCQVKGLYPHKFVLLGERMLISLGRLYEKTYHLPVVVEEGVILDIVSCVQVPMKIKYSCARQSSWRIAKEVFLSVMCTALCGGGASEGSAVHPDQVWTVVSDALDNFLFSQYKPPQERTPEELKEDELIDCDIIEFLKEKVLLQPSLFPHEFLLSIMVILNKGSIHSASQTRNSDLNQNIDSYLTIREDFAKICFETLLQFSLLENDEEQVNGNHDLLSLNNLCLKDDDEKITNKLAVTSLLYRFKEVLKKYVADEQLHHPVPLPAQRVHEMAFVLKAIATLISSLKKTPTEVDRTWGQLFDLYPDLVAATASTAPNVASSLKQALLQYADLLQPPPPTT